MTFEGFKNKLLALDVQKIASDSMNQTKDDLIEWQKDQLFSGKTSSNTPIRPPYKSVTRRIKRAKGQPTDRVTLKDTGDFYDGIIADVGLYTFRLTSDDAKTFKLEGKYGSKIFGLNKVSRAGYSTDLRPVFIRNIKTALGL